ncbi:MAG: HD domain-containing phosphohydrolase [Candidatus Thiodiazotropha sp. LLP2]
MWQHLKVSLTDLISSVSEAMDLVDSSLVDHQVRTGYVCTELARAAKLQHTADERLFLSAMLHDIGALSPEEKIGIHEIEDLRPEPHCLRGAKLFREADWLAPSAEIIEWHHTSYISHLEEGRTLANENVLLSQMLLLADRLERAIDRTQFILHQVDHLKQYVIKLEGKILHTDVVVLFNEISKSEAFWLELVSRHLSSRLKNRNPLRLIEINFKSAMALASVFKDMTDFRSRFTATHSVGVARCAYGIAEKIGFSAKDLQQIELAGFLHDIGKLVVPNSILCKPGKLTPDDYSVIRQHSYYSNRILSRVRGFEQIAEWASSHHERLDGSGYTEHLVRHELDLGARVVAVSDVATAISEHRPYRESGDQDVVIRELRSMVKNNKLECSIVDVLESQYSDIMGAAFDAQEADAQRYVERYALIE